MKSIREESNLRGKKVILRLDLNVPIENGVIVDDFRIKQSFPTIQFLKNAGAKIIILAHLEGKGGTTLVPIFEYLKKSFEITFVTEYWKKEETKKIIDAMQEGSMVLFENIRLDPREKNNDPDFAKELANLGDIYVNEAFSAAHRKHTSIVGIPLYIPGFAGLLFVNEVEQLSKAFHPARPFLFILGGAKFDTKMPLIQKFLKNTDHIFVGGALANNFFKEEGLPIGASVVSEGHFGLRELLESGKIVIPIDVVVETEAGEKMVKFPKDVLPHDAIWDVGPEAMRGLKSLVESAKFVLWNGPLGNYEIGYKKSTEELAHIVADTSEKTGLISIVGGGDTVASIESLGLSNKFTFLSTAGGAMLDFLINETLPGIEALQG